MPRLEAEGIAVPGRIFDTMLAAHLIQPDLYKSLEKSSTLYLDLRPFKHLVTTDLRRPAADAQVSALMFHEQYRILEKLGMLSLFCDTIMPATRVLMGMTKRGIKVDEAHLAAWQEELQDELVDLEASWYEISLGLNPHSPHKLKQYLYHDLGMEEQANKYGGVTTDEGAIKALIEQYPFHTDKLNLLLRIREISKLKSTYSEVGIAKDGCVHPGYLPMNKDTDSAGAATGRLASSEPNIQNVPPRARCMYVPHEEGMVLVEGDFSQIELRIAAALSDDSALIEALRGDVFRAVMSLLGCDRVRAKNVVYGSLYGAGPRKLAALLRQRGLPTTERDARDLQERLARAYPRLWGWRTEVGRTATRERVLVNPFSRRRYFYAGSADIPAAIDFLPQSSAADILWSVLRNSEEVAKGNQGNLLTTVHDSLLFECRDECVGRLVGGLRGVLEAEWPQVAPGFKVPVKFKVGQNWGEMEEYRGD
jgi:DNA polymerase-1